MAIHIFAYAFLVVSAVRPHEDAVDLEGLPAAPKTATSDFARRGPAKNSLLLKAVHLATPNEELCKAAAGAIDGGLKPGIRMIPDASSSSCAFLDVNQSSCVSSSPLWTCRSYVDASEGKSSPSCQCVWTPICHGIKDAFEVAAGSMQCLPTETSCHCWGIRSCNSKLGWSCQALPGVNSSSEESYSLLCRALQAQLDLQKPEERGNKSLNLSKDLLQRGGCDCHAERLVLSLPLDVEELSSLSKFPLDDLRALSHETASGQTVKNTVRDKDSSGNDRVVLTIGDDKNRSKPEKSDGKSTAPRGTEAEKAPDSKETCLITGGKVKLGLWEGAAVFLMASPSILAAILIAAICWFSSSFDWTRTGNLRYSTSNPELPLRKPPTSFVVFCVVHQFLSLLNVTSVLTTSHVATAKLEDQGDQMGLPLSSLLLAAAPVGGSLGTVLIASFAMHRPWLVCIGTCLLIAASNIIYAFGLREQSFLMMMFTRLLGGFAGGADYWVYVYLSRLSSQRQRTTVFAWSYFGYAAGLVAGPLLASLLATEEISNQLQLLNPHLVVGEACAYTVALLSLSVAVLGSFCLPSDEVLQVAALKQDLALRPFWWADDAMSPVKWIAHVCCCLTVGARMLCRQAWEASAVMVLASHYCLGYGLAGWGVLVGLFAYVVLQGTFTQVKAVSDRILVRCFQSIEIVGVLLMHRNPLSVDETLKEDVLQEKTVHWNIALFLIGSSLFYSGNCLGAAPIDSFTTKVGPRAECLMFYKMLLQWLFLGIGSFLSRALISRDPHQNVLVALLLPSAIAQFLVAELFFSVVACARDPKQDSPIVEEEESEAEAEG